MPEYKNLSGTYPWTYFLFHLTKNLFNVESKQLRHDLTSKIYTDERFFNDFSKQLVNVKQNTVFPLLLAMEEGAHANLLVIDYDNREVYLWDPNGKRFYDIIDGTEDFYNVMNSACDKYNYRFVYENTCKSAPQLKQSLCEQRISKNSGGGLCASYTAVFTLLYLRSKLSFTELDKKLDILINQKDACAFHSLFTIISDMCADWLISIIPNLKSEVVYHKRFGNKSDFSQHLAELTELGKKVIGEYKKGNRSEMLDSSKILKPIAERDLDLIKSQIDLILAQLENIETSNNDTNFNTASTNSTKSSCELERDYYKNLYLRYRAFLEDIENKM